MQVNVPGSMLATYFYDAAGNKLRNVSNAGGTWDYEDGIVYKNGQVQFIQTEEGRVTLAADSINYHYIIELKDYLGNVRASYSAGATANLIQENDYFPFGLITNYYDLNSKNRYLYNGKELQTDLTEQYDYGARFYDPVIGRWAVIDPMAEKGRRWSPYVYGFDNALRFEDPDGMWPDWGELAAGVGETVLGGIAAVGGVVVAVSTGVTVVGAAGGVTLATLGVATTGFGISKVADSFRSNEKKEMNIPSSAASGIVEGAAKKIGANEGTAKIAGGIADLATGGKPKSVLDALGAVSTALGMVDSHSSKMKKPGMQQDHTKTSDPKEKAKPAQQPQFKVPSLPTAQGNFLD